jgi:class 3 adenylate cyclase/tetratricopeptide (TPR) repeat protein
MGAAEPLTVYLPALLAQRIADGRIATPEELPAATLFADLSGFTELAEQLAAAGSAGPERLQEILNVELGRLIACVHRHGGDILKFAGDAIVALWPAHTIGLTAAVGRACRAGLEIHARRDGLGVRVGVGAGHVIPLAVGEEHGRREFLVAGAPMVEMGRAERLAAPGEVLLTQEAWAHVAQVADGEPREGAIRLLGLRGAFAGAAASATALELPRDVPEDMLRAFIPRTLRDQLDAGHGGWGSELRPVTVMFVDLPLLGGGGLAEVPLIESLVAAIQREIYAIEGSVNKLLLDDKGLILLAAFGLPPRVHENNAARALHAALRISDHLREHGVGHGIGLATGRAFCGVYGSAARREYSLLGDVVNLAARLMQLAEDDVLCDAATARALGEGLVGEPFIVHVRGKATPVVVHRAVHGRAATIRFQTAGRLFGRERERALLVRAIERLAGGAGGLVVITGEAGLGKSALVAELRALARAAAVGVVSGHGGDIEQSAAYHAWREVLLDLCARAGASSVDARSIWLEEQLADHPRGVEWTPLLAPLLDLPDDDTPATARLGAAARAECTRELVLHVLRRTARPVIVLDDAQWLDPASWSLCAAVRRGVPGALLVVAGRLSPTDPPPPLVELIGDGPVETIALEPLAADDIESMVAARLAVVRLDAPLAEILRDRAEGNPLFAIELALALKAAGEVVCDGGVARLGARGVTLESLPETVQGVVLSRLAQQTQQQQFTLKVASVVGREFGYRIVRDVHPLEVDRAHVREHCDALARASLLASLRGDPEPAYVFRHAVIQDTAYSLLAFAQRRQLHRAIAEWQEARGAVGPETYPVLAHHWRRAEDPGRARDYAARSGEQASARGAFHEAAYFFEQALALDDAAARDDEARLRRARWRRLLGEARNEIGAHEAALQALHEGLAELGRPLPRTRLGWLWMGLAQSIRFAFGAARGRARAIAEDDPGRRRDAELAHLAALATLELFFAVRLAPMIVISLWSSNLAERSGSYGPSSTAYNNLGYLLDLLGAKRASGRMFDRARMGDVRAQCRAYVSQGLLALGRADFDTAVTLFARAKFVAEEAGDRFSAASAISSLGTVCELRGEFAGALAQADSLTEAARISGNRRFALWAEIATGTANTLLGRDAEAIAWISRRGDALAGEDILTTIGVHGLRAYAYLRAGDLAEALRHADRGAAEIRRTGPGVFTHIKALTGVAETYLAAWADALSRGTGAPAALEKAARRAVRDLAAYARTFPIGRTRAERARGDLLWLTGRRAAAHAAWQRAAAAGDASGLAFDAALARLALARHDGPDRAAHLAAALATFTRIGAARERALAERAAVHA